MQSNSTQVQTPLTTADIDALAQRLHRIRDGWHVGSLVTLLAELATAYDGPILRKAAIAAAQDTNIRTPKGIEWTAADFVTRGPSSAGELCAVCGKTRDGCMWERPLVRKAEDVDQHVYLTAAELRAQSAARTRVA